MTTSAAEAAKRYQTPTYEPCTVGVEVDLEGGLRLILEVKMGIRGEIASAVVDGDNLELIKGHQMTMASFSKLWEWKESHPSELNIEQRKMKIYNAIVDAVQAHRAEQKEELESPSVETEVRNPELSGVAAA